MKGKRTTSDVYTHVFLKSIFLMNTIFKHLITFVEKRLGHKGFNFICNFFYLRKPEAYQQNFKSVLPEG